MFTLIICSLCLLKFCQVTVGPASPPRMHLFTNFLFLIEIACSADCDSCVSCSWTWTFKALAGFLRSTDRCSDFRNEPVPGAE
ncbi:hypothetical protein KC19_1G247900 [Ceratodon purpureus]|uniref:Secreted protein n=1 Tax=Ceratodon purpureus TaxID=3225 RepID=A0A8T0J9H9_CERPU|nr:hypothetical protein KC19_1G247900 [Ceratodon purpureus]